MAVKTTGIPIEWLQVAAYTIPADFPESDGTLEWDSTTLVLVKAGAGGKIGIGFTYADTATARLTQDRLAALVVGRDAMAVTESWNARTSTLRRSRVMAWSSSSSRTR
jgi:hypothetical protein